MRERSLRSRAGCYGGGILILAFLTASAILLLRNAATTTAGLTIFEKWPYLVPSETVARNLESRNTNLIYSSLSVLATRKDPLATESALLLLRSHDEYMWLNAALYLGSCENLESVPFLIKGLRHPAWRTHSKCAELLRDLTGEDYGTDAVKWRRWWTQSHPMADFQFWSSDTNRETANGMTNSVLMER
jgi:hypothetical protein